MPLKLKNSARPSQDYETVNVLGLEIPLTDSLPFGAQVELFDLQQKFDDGEFGQFEYLLRMLCVFTRLLPKGEQLRYEWLARQDLEPEEMGELIKGVNTLLTHLNTQTAEQAKAAGGKPKGKARTATPS